MGKRGFDRGMNPSGGRKRLASQPHISINKYIRERQKMELQKDLEQELNEIENIMNKKLVQCSTPTCGPCRMLKMMIQNKYLPKYSDNYIYVDVNLVENTKYREAMVDRGLYRVPTLFIEDVDGNLELVKGSARDATEKFFSSLK